MIKEIKEKLISMGRWIKKKAKEILIALGIVGVAMAGGGAVVDNQINPYAEIGEQYITYLAVDSRVRIGGEDIDQFKPELHLGKWGDEAWIKISYPTDKKIKPNRDLFSNKIKWEDTDKEIHFYPLEPREFEENGRIVKQLEQGGFEFEIILKEKPASNVIVLDIESQGLKFYYQPELTQKEIDDGAFRPENVVGSYAVYHKTQDKFFKTEAEGKKYKTGKMGQFYYPYMIDSNGWKIRAEDFKIDIGENGKGQIIVTTPQNFIDNAVYPIKHIAGNTFGYTSEGSSDRDLEDKMVGMAPTATSGGVISTFHGWFKVVAGSENVKMALYEYTPDAVALYDYTGDISISETSYPVTAQSAAAVVGYTIVDTTTYYIIAWGGGSNSPVVAFDTPGGPSYFLYKSQSYAAWPNPLLGEDRYAETYHNISIYCTYTPEAAEGNMLLMF